MENGVQGACLDEVIVVDPGEEKWTRRERKKMYSMDSVVGDRTQKTY